MDIKRIVIYSKDIEMITGKSERSSRKIMTAMRRKLGKEKHQFISLGEFCAYSGIPESEVLGHLAKNTY